MKKSVLTVTVLAALIMGCEKDELDCGCIKYTQNTVDPEPTDDPTKFYIKESVECQPEVLYGQDELGRVYFIKCD